MFALMDFRKTVQVTPGEKDVITLKPCVYKKRWCVCK